ncbi:MAG: rhodanese-like domain-containing protein [Ekhidna sp.]|nr:rhodanese-like domain-containing protein [Ekhidna sp.]
MFSLFKKKPKGFQDITANEFAELKKAKNHVVLDVRSPGELAEGAIPGYKMINFFDFSFKSKISQLDKSKTYLVYCKSGNRSTRACKTMAKMGFENLYNLKGGIGAWNAR